MKTYLSLFLLLLVTGCGANPSAKTTTGTGTTTPPPTTTATTSMWAGTYTGSLNFTGCPAIGNCGGDVVTIQVSQAANAAVSGEFLATLTIADTDATQNKTFQWTGTAGTQTEAAPVGPGSNNAGATMTTNTGQTISLAGVGNSSSTDPVVMQSLTVHNAPVVNGVSTQGAYLGTLTRVVN